MEFEKVTPFYSGYLKTKLPKELAKKLLKLCLNTDKKINEWEDYDFYTWNLPEIKELNKIQIDMVKEYMNTFNSVKKSDSFNFKGWVNIREDKSWHTPHYHGRIPLVFNVYIGVPEGTMVSFVNPDPMGGVEQTDDSSRQYDLIPEFGTMILTPGWWLHWTEPTFKNEKRISMSSNVTIH
jgi:hypothetical protein